MKKILLFLLLSFGYCSITNAQSCVGEAGYVDWSIWLGFSILPDSNDLIVMENYPNYPDVKLELASIETPINFADYYASLTRGYIYFEESGEYQFNLTSKRNSKFFLSTDENRENLSKKAEILTQTGTTEHNKETNQTSQNITLNFGQNYYFEIFHFENGGDDNLSLYWRKVGSLDQSWKIVNYSNIKKYACGGTCNPRGTPCDDGNSLSVNDKEDGFCNCTGEFLPPQAACVGEREKVEAYYFDNITGALVENQLIDSPKFPLVPDRKELLNGAFGPLTPNSKNTYGSLVQGYLTVPVTGQYSFNITGDNQSIFFLSNNYDILSKQNNKAISANFLIEGVEETRHDDSNLQTVGPLFLEVGKYYYYEIQHKEQFYEDFFSVFWKTPWRSDWKKIPKFYLYDYNCELSCISQGTPCDDGNVNTNNDQYDSNCNCVGTPCTGLGCDDVLGQYTYYDKSASTNKQLSSVENSWESCANENTNPNPSRSPYHHWIKYDFGRKYFFQDSWIWNYNVLNQTDKGFRQVYIDYSNDGINWTPLGGLQTWPQATGNLNYEGFTGPNFNNIKARYILVSAVNNHGNLTCYGFSDIKIGAVQCLDRGTSCDDGNPLTKYDVYDDDCNCYGVDIDCNTDNINLGEYTIVDSEIKAKVKIESTNSISFNQNISFTAGNSIVLLPGFEVKTQGVFKAQIANCLQAAFEENQKTQIKQKFEGQESLYSESAELKEIVFKLNKPEHVKLVLKDENNDIIVQILDNDLVSLGTHIKYLPTNKLKKGQYVIELDISGNVVKERFNVE
jgi:hypothetical protein